MLACLLLSIGIMEGGMINPLKKIISKQRPYHVLSEARVVKLEETIAYIQSLPQGMFRLPLG